MRLASGVYGVRRRIRAHGLAVLDKRTELARAAFQFRAALARDLGGEDELSAAQHALLDLVTRDRVLLDTIDRWLFDPAAKSSRVVCKRRRTAFRIVLDRGQIADAMTRRLSLLGLKRHARPLDLAAQLAAAQPTQAQETANPDGDDGDGDGADVGGAGEHVSLGPGGAGAVGGDDGDGGGGEVGEGGVRGAGAEPGPGGRAVLVGGETPVDG